MDSSKHWLSVAGVTAYARLTLVTFVVVLLMGIGKQTGVLAMAGKPYIGDFIAFWGASHLALAGHAQDAYDAHQLLAAERVALPAVNEGFPWFYLQTFYLVILPLAMLPYPAAYLAFMVTTLVPYLAALRQVLRPLRAGLFLAAYPGLWINLIPGQNGFLTAALAGYALLIISTQPILAGVCIGLLAIKPHLAILFPVALLANRSWLTFFVAVATVIVFMALGIWTFGSATLDAALASLDDARLYLESGKLPWFKMPSLFSALLHLGVPISLAYAGHAGLAGVALVCVWRVWRVRRNTQLRGAVLMTAALMMSPYVYDYDLTWLAFPIAWMVVLGLQQGWLPGEREILLGAWLLPMFMIMVFAELGVQLAPVILTALLWIIMRRSQISS
jgi:hypothetical protein